MSQTKKLIKDTNKQNKYKWKLTNSDESGPPQNDDESTDYSDDISDYDSDYFEEGNTTDIMKYMKEKLQTSNEDDDLIIQEDTKEYREYEKANMKFDIFNGFSNIENHEDYIKYLSEKNGYKKNKKYYYLIIKESDDIRSACLKRNQFMFFGNMYCLDKPKHEQRKQLNLKMVSCNIKTHPKRTKKGKHDYHCLFEVKEGEHFQKLLNSVSFKSSIYWIINKYQYEEIRDKIQRMKH